MLKKLGVFFLVGLMTLSACGKKEANIYELRTEYVGDASKVSNLVGALDYGEDLNYKSLELLTDDGAREIKIYLDGNIGDVDENNFIKQNSLIFSLIKNLEKIGYVVIDENITMPLELVSRADVDLYTKKIYGMTSEEIYESEETIEKIYKEIKDK